MLKTKSVQRVQKFSFETFSDILKFLTEQLPLTCKMSREVMLYREHESDLQLLVSRKYNPVTKKEDIIDTSDLGETMYFANDDGDYVSLPKECFNPDGTPNDGGFSKFCQSMRCDMWQFEGIETTEMN